MPRTTAGAVSPFGGGRRECAQQRVRLALPLSVDLSLSLATLDSLIYMGTIADPNP